MSASREKKLRQDQTASGYVDPKAEKELEEKKAEKRSNVLYSVIAVLFVLVVAASFLWRSNVISRNATALTIDGEKYSAAEVNFYYQNVYRGFLQSNSYFISYLGLDTNASLKSQTVNATAASMMGVEEGSSWHDYIMDNTVKQMTMIQRGLKQAQEEGYQFPASVQEQYEDSLNSLKTSAESTGMSVKAYLQKNLGAIMTEKVYNQQVLRMLQYQAYAQSYSDSLTYTDEQVEAKDAEDPAVYNSYSYNQYYLSSSRYLDDDATNAEKAAAAEADAKSLVSDEINSVEALDAAIAALEVNADTTASSSAMDDTRYTSVSSVVAQWISDSSRQEGDKTYIANTSTTTDDDGNEVETISGYYVVYYRSSSDNSTPLVNVRHMLAGFEGGTTENGTTTYSDEEKAAAKEKAESWLQAWEDGDATEESFAALANENSTDTGSNTNGGLYENVYPGQMVSAFNNWCFDENRKAGDTGIVETSYGYHVMYFVGQSDETYREYLIKNDLTSEDYTNWYNGLVDALDMTVGDTSYIRTNLVMKAN